MLMKRKYRLILFAFLFCSLLTSCNQNPKQSKEEKQEPQPAKTKPGATSQDSLKVTLPSVVFFEPDSIQLEKIREITKDEVFKTMVHEYFFMSRNTKAYLQQHRPELKTLEAKKFRYIVFVKSDKSTKV